jgi:hypothetical protein
LVLIREGEREPRFVLVPDLPWIARSKINHEQNDDPDGRGPRYRISQRSKFQEIEDDDEDEDEYD